MDQQPNPMPNPPAGGAPTGQKNTGMAFVAYILFFIPLLTDAKNDPFVHYHVRQGLGLLLAWVATVVLSWFFYIWPLIDLLQLALVVLWVLGVVNVFQGKQQPVPLVGQLFEKLSI